MHYTYTLTHTNSSQKYFSAAEGHPDELFLSYYPENLRVQQLIVSDGPASFTKTIHHQNVTLEESRAIVYRHLSAVIDRDLYLNSFDDPRFNQPSQSHTAILRRQQSSSQSPKAQIANRLNAKKAQQGRRGMKDSLACCQQRNAAISLAKKGKSRPDLYKKIVVLDTVFESWKDAIYRTGYAHETLRRMLVDGRAWNVDGAPPKDLPPYVDGRTLEGKALKAAKLAKDNS
jgi:hypothetical protein